MQLSKETVDFLARLIKVAKILKIESVIIDHECARGHFKAEGSMIIHRDNLPKFEFTTLGISRIDVLNNRLSLLGDNAAIKFEEKIKSPTDVLVSKLLLSNKKTKLDFKCADPAVMDKAPKIFKDPVCYTFKINKEDVTLFSKALSAVRGETLALVGSKTGVIGKLSDMDGDMLDHTISEELVYNTLPNGTPKDEFYFTYKNKILIPLLREAMTDETIDVNITERGLLNLKVLGINVYITREV